ncbi:MAG: hypothetical protein PSX81_01065 [bacterium]|nr:hypothetical protein [bacterium]
MEKQDKYREAILLLDKAIEKDQKNIKALLDRAVDKSIIKDYKGSIEDYSKIIELDYDNGLAFLNRGKNKKRLEDYVGAIADFDKAISTKGGELFYMDKVENSFVAIGFEFDIKMEEIKFERGIAYYNIDSLKLAFDDFNFSIQKKYLLPDSYYWRGLIYLQYNMKSEACNDLNKAKELGDPDAQDLISKNCK